MSAGSYELRLSDANAALSDGRLDEAEHKFKTLSLDFPDPAGLDGLARVAGALSDWQLALDRWEDCLARFSPEPRNGWLLGRAWALFNLKRYADAEMGFEAICESFPQHQGGFVGVALSRFHQSKWDDAIRAWDILFDHFPETREPNFLMPYAHCLEAAGEPSRALKALS
jgi:tetratricopeptide (TPR) repeat protein